MQAEKFVGYLPQSISWSEDGKTVYFDWNPEMDTLRSRYKISINGGDPEKVSHEELKNMPSRRGAYNKAQTKKVYSKNGDLFLLNIQDGTHIQITNTLDSESSPQFSGDETKIVFSKSNNLFTWDIKSGIITQLTNFKKGKKKSESKKTKNEQWLENDQLAYFEILQQRKAVRELRKERSERMKVQRPKEIYYGSNHLSGIQISPDLHFVSYRIIKDAKSKRTQVPDYVTESGFTESSNGRPKVGSPQSVYETGIYDLKRDTFFTIDTKEIEGIYDKPAFLKEYHKDTIPYSDKYEIPREVVILGPYFSEDSKAAVVVRSADHKDRWIMQLDMASGSLKLLDRQRDEAWIGGPGISGWGGYGGSIGWLPDNKTLWFQSEESGYSHLYTINVETGKKKALTSGNYEILNVRLSNDKQTFYITANAEGPHEHHFYRIPVNGGDLEKITTLPGNHEVSMSPDEKQLAIRYSYSNKPWELYLMPNRTGAEMKAITKSTTDVFNKYNWRDPEIIRFTARDGVKVPARIYRPKKKNRKKGPAVIFVHGAGYLQNVHKWWSSYYREYMFHNLLTDNGYTVLDIDYRASNGYGRDWRTAIYRHMGGKDLDDQVDGARFLVEECNIDPDRIGIYGGSYGGFITLMALFNSPGTFKSGAALRSVTDWAHYNHGYTSNILNTPVEDSLAYYRSSPIYHAEGLQDNLLILHGMLDSNVQFQDVVRLAQRLIELGKDKWEFAVFPLEQHGFVEPSSWADEYKRIFKLFQETLRE
ncbi:MAG: prolyl oligopeptidase family serine peptidase [Bacteroidetes bacterium]|nr:prolyl oligopeptidase family serine peptidase [Bacteroidota bacterium]